MRTLTANLTAMLATRTHTRARCIWIAALDGTVIGLTDHDKDLTVDLTDISDIPVELKADTGILPSNIATGVGLDVDSFTIEGPLTSLITRADVLGRRYNRARVRIFDVDWTQDVLEVIPLLQGIVADVRIISSRFELEIRSETERLNQTIGRLISPYCDATFGDSRCQAVVPTVMAEVTAVTNDYQFTVDQAGVYDDDYFVFGRVDFTTGDLAGVRPVEIFAYTGSSSLVTLLVPLPQQPEVGDMLLLKRGCSKLKISDDASVPTCVSYNNVLNFRGFDQVTGSDQYLKIPVPGE